MDEMDKYRNGIEHRRSERRQLKNGRRRGKPEPQPKFWEPVFIIDMVLLIGMTIALIYLTN